MNIDNTINKSVAPFADALFSVVFTEIPVWTASDGTVWQVPIVLLWLIIAGLFFTFYLEFPNFRLFKHAWEIVSGKHDDNTKEGDINRFQALTTTLSGTVGLGNIAGVALAVSVGGPGATFWMILIGFIGMTTKFVECTLGVKYRIKNPGGTISGGPMYYLRESLKGTKADQFGQFLAGFYAVCIVFGTFGAGSLFQSNQAYQQLIVVTGGEMSFWADKGWLFGIFLALLVGAVILGGIKSIAKVASKIVPFMGALYLFFGVLVIGLNYQNILPAFELIFVSALTMKAGVGGLIGAIIMGVQRGAFSNEAGLGSAAITHATAKTDQPVTQGLVAMLGPFIDTIIICTITALVIIVSGVHETYTDGMAGVSLTSDAFSQTFSWFPYMLAFIVFLFAFSTMISWSYYGTKGMMFLFGESTLARDAFKVAFCLVTIIGTTANLDAVVKLTDAFVFMMAVPNVIGLYILSREVKRDLQTYEKTLK